MKHRDVVAALGFVLGIVGVPFAYAQETFPVRQRPVLWNTATFKSWN